MENNPNRRVSRGRQKVEMVKMTSESNLQVTFSKRRSGLFKKASELCTLCGVEMVIVVFSPGRKAFSFGHPSVDAMVDRFLNRNKPVPTNMNTGTMQLIEAHRNANVRELNQQLMHVLGQLDVEKKRGQELKRLRKASQAQYWWESPIESLELRQLEQLKTTMEELKRTVNQQADRLLIQTTDSNTLFPPNNNDNTVPFCGGSSSSNQGAGQVMVNNTLDLVPKNNMNNNINFPPPGFSSTNNTPINAVNNANMPWQLPRTLPAPSPAPAPAPLAASDHVCNNNVGFGGGLF